MDVGQHANWRTALTQNSKQDVKRRIKKVAVLGPQASISAPLQDPERPTTFQADAVYHGLGRAGSGDRRSADPLKIWYFCVVCTHHLHLDPFALTIGTISRGGMKIDVSCYIITLDF